MTAITEKELQEWTALCVDPWNGSHLRGDLSRVTCTAMPRLIEEVTELREENKQLRKEVERLVRGQTLDGFSMSYGKLLLKCEKLRTRAERAEAALREAGKRVIEHHIRGKDKTTAGYYTAVTGREVMGVDIRKARKALQQTTDEENRHG